MPGKLAHQHIFWEQGGGFGDGGGDGGSDSDGGEKKLN